MCSTHEKVKNKTQF